MSAYFKLSEIDPRALAILALAALALVAVLALALYAGLRLGRRAGRLEAERATKAARDDAVRRSKAVLTGQIGEQLAPYFPGFPCDPAEARFIGKPVDFIAFPGAADGGRAEVVFIEVKTGEARLSAPERAIKEAVLAGRVRWAEYRLPAERGGKR